MSEKPIEPIINGKTLSTFPIIKNKTRKSAFTSIEHCTEDPSMCNKPRKKKEKACILESKNCNQLYSQIT